MKETSFSQLPGSYDTGCMKYVLSVFRPYKTKYYSKIGKIKDLCYYNDITILFVKISDYNN